MSFINSAGTIVIDAVLTDLGRKRMAQGKFKVAKFAVGDDEIDYTLLGPFSIAAGDIVENGVTTGTYNRKTTIENTPQLEALSQTNANMNYGLLTLSRNDLLYLPILKINEKLRDSVKSSEGGARYYLSVNDETTKKLKDSLNTGLHILEASDTTNKRIVVESGLETDELDQTSAMREAYLANTSLLDKSFYTYCDGRFFINILGAPRTATFRNSEDGFTPRVSFGILEESLPTSLPAPLEYFQTYIVNGVDNLVFNRGDGKDTEVSALRGPRGTATAIGFVLEPSLQTQSTGDRDPKYAVYGTVSSALFGGSNRYDYIDTTIYVEGRASLARTQIPIRIVRYVGT